MRIIDADEIMGSPVWMAAGSAIDPYEQGYMDGLDAAEKAIKEAPTISPDSLVKRGRWIENPFLLGTSIFCSLCDSFYGMPHGKFKYCPNCGALMED